MEPKKLQMELIFIITPGCILILTLILKFIRTGEKLVSQVRHQKYINNSKNLGIGQILSFLKNSHTNGFEIAKLRSEFLVYNIEFINFLFIKFTIKINHKVLFTVTF